MKLINDHMAVKADLKSPAGDGFLMLAGEVGAWRGPFPSVPTGLVARRGVRPARYDVVVLIRTVDVHAAQALRESVAYKAMATTLAASARRSYQLVASNAARMDDVDHGPDRAFLFNYFYADDRETLLKVWEHTAGWFQSRTALRDSALMRPLDGEPADYGIINHASWPNLRTFLPSLLFRPTFRSFVLANFKANGIAAQPIIYRRA